MSLLPGPIARVAILSLSSGAYTFCVNGGVINGSELTDYLAGYAPPYFATLWATREARRSGYSPAYHYALYVWFFWPILIPHCILKTRGRSGLPLAVGVYLLLWLPSAAGLAGWWLYFELPDLR